MTSVFAFSAWGGEGGAGAGTEAAAMSAWSFVASATSSFLLSAEIARGPKGVFARFARRFGSGAARRVRLLSVFMLATPSFPSIVGVVVNTRLPGAAISALDHPRQAAFGRVERDQAGLERVIEIGLADEHVVDRLQVLSTVPRASRRSRDR